MFSSNLFFCLPCLLPPFTVPCKMVFGQTWWMGDMTIPLQFASLYNGQEVFVSSDCLLDLGTGILVGNMVFVWDVVSCRSTSFPWLVFFFGALLWQNRDTFQDNTDKSSINKVETSLEWLKYFSQFQDTAYALPCHIHLPVCLWIMDLHSRAPKKNTSHGNEVLPHDTDY